MLDGYRVYIGFENILCKFCNTTQIDTYRYNIAKRLLQM